jgi:predicted metal-dependent hydrolase
VVEGTRGAFHDLDQSFDRVNARYFGATMPRPRLTWSRSFTGRKFGHYDFLKDLVMVSSTLDQERVPQFVVDYLMFHELLHKKHGVRWVNGRRYAHTREFYAEERQVPQYDEADAWLTKLARG